MPYMGVWSWHRSRIAPVKAFSASNLPQSVLSGDGWALRGECPRRVRCGSPLKDVLGDRDVLIRLSYQCFRPDERAHRADERDQADLERLSVQVAVEVVYMALDLGDEK